MSRKPKPRRRRKVYMIDGVWCHKRGECFVPVGPMEHYRLSMDELAAHTADARKQKATP